jgi:hypothetical protein
MVRLKGGDFEPGIAENLDDAKRIARPVASAVFGKAFELMADLLVKIFGPDDDATVVARRDGSQGAEVDGGGHHESAGVVGVLADEVDAAWGKKYRGVGTKPLRVFFRNTVYIQHAGFFLRKK